MIKGLEAMVVESFTAARAYGVEDSVLASLAETFPGIDWERQGTYFFQRVIQHGRRRAEEMREAAETVREIGLEPWSAAGTAERQAFVADLADAGAMGDRLAARTDWRVDADRVLAAARPQALNGTTRTDPMDPDYLPFHPDPVAAAVRRAEGRGGCALPRVRSRGGLSVREGAQVHAVRRAEGKAVRAARLPRLRHATSSSRRPATATTTARSSTRSPIPTAGRAAWRRSAAT